MIDNIYNISMNIVANFLFFFFKYAEVFSLFMALIPLVIWIFSTIITDYLNINLKVCIVYSLFHLLFILVVLGSYVCCVINANHDITHNTNWQDHQIGGVLHVGDHAGQTYLTSPHSFIRETDIFNNVYLYNCYVFLMPVATVIFLIIYVLLWKLYNWRWLGTKANGTIIPFVFSLTLLLHALVPLISLVLNYDTVFNIGRYLMFQIGFNVSTIASLAFTAPFIAFFLFCLVAYLKPDIHEKALDLNREIFFLTFFFFILFLVVWLGEGVWTIYGYDESHYSSVTILNFIELNVTSYSLTSCLIASSLFPLWAIFSWGTVYRNTSYSYYCFILFLECFILVCVYNATSLDKLYTVLIVVAFLIGLTFFIYAFFIFDPGNNNNYKY